jgi:hypothetical protein
MEAVEVESAGKFLIDRHFNDLENNFSNVIHLHAIFVTITAHSLGEQKTFVHLLECFGTLLQIKETKSLIR